MTLTRISLREIESPTRRERENRRRHRTLLVNRAFYGLWAVPSAHPGRNLAPGHTVCRLTVFHNERKDREFTTDQVWGHVGPGPLDELETDRRWPTGQAFNRLMSLSSLGPPAAGLQLAGARVKRRAGGPTRASGSQWGASPSATADL